MLNISPNVISHKLSIRLTFKLIRKKRWAYDVKLYEAMRLVVNKLRTIGFIRKMTYPIWIVNSVLLKKTSGTWRMRQNYTNLNKAYPNDSFLY